MNKKAQTFRALLEALLLEALLLEPRRSSLLHFQMLLEKTPSMWCFPEKSFYTEALQCFVPNVFETAFSHSKISLK